MSTLPKPIGQICTLPSRASLIFSTNCRCPSALRVVTSGPYWGLPETSSRPSVNKKIILGRLRASGAARMSRAWASAAT